LLVSDLFMPSQIDGTHRRPWQFSMRTLVLSPVYSVLLIGGFYLLGGTWPVARGIGFADITLHFVVIDSATNSPVSGAVVELYNPEGEGSMIQTVKTSPPGTARVVMQDVPFELTGGRFLERDQAVVRFDELCFEISAPGYKPARYWLAHFAGRLHDLNSSSPIPTVVVKLDRPPEPSSKRTRY
jgi:hypothetical protein